MLFQWYWNVPITVFRAGDKCFCECNSEGDQCEMWMESEKSVSVIEAPAFRGSFRCLIPRPTRDGTLLSLGTPWDLMKAFLYLTGNIFR